MLDIMSKTLVMITCMFELTLLWNGFCFIVYVYKKLHFQVLLNIENVFPGSHFIWFHAAYLTTLS